MSVKTTLGLSEWIAPPSTPGTEAEQDGNLRNWISLLPCLIGNRGMSAYPYKSAENVPGCYGYSFGRFAGHFYFGTGGTDADKMKKPKKNRSAGTRFRPKCE